MAAARAEHADRPFPGEVRPHERIEAGDVVHVEVRERDQVDLLQVAEAHRIEATRPAVEQHAHDPFAGAQRRQHGVVLAGRAEHVDGECVDAVAGEEQVVGHGGGRG